jgi:hypothetical protein
MNHCNSIPFVTIFDKPRELLNNWMSPIDSLLLTKKSLTRARISQTNQVIKQEQWTVSARKPHMAEKESAYSDSTVPGALTE